jgi:small subunit ribosomal protein S1
MLKYLLVDRDDRKMSLGMKQLTQDPWDRYYHKYPGSTHNGIVEKLHKLWCVFVELEEVEWTGYTDLSWTKKIIHQNSVQ